MTFAAMAGRLVSIVHPPSPRMVILISRPATREELRLMSEIFDKVIVENGPPSFSTDCQSAPPPQNILYATRMRSHAAMFGKLRDADSAVWISERDFDILSLRQVAGTEPETLLLKRSPEPVEARNLPELPAAVYASEANGRVLAGDLERLPVSRSVPDFVIVRESDELLHALSAAAKSSLHHLFFRGFSGLES